MSDEIERGLPVWVVRHLAGQMAHGEQRCIRCRSLLSRGLEKITGARGWSPYCHLLQTADRKNMTVEFHTEFGVPDCRPAEEAQP